MISLCRNLIVGDGFPMDAELDYPQEYRDFIRLFNEGDYFEAHEVLEDLWVVEVPPLRNYYKGLIQMAVAICHWERGNPSGARKLYVSATSYLKPYPSVMEGFALAEFLRTMDVLFAPLAIGTVTDSKAQINPDGIPKLHLAS